MFVKSLIKKILLILLLVVVMLTLRSLWYAGFFSTIKMNGQYNEKIIKGLIGAEDITIDQKSGKALISSCDRRGIDAGKGIKGAIYLLDLNKMDTGAKNLTGSFKQEDFRPHGISLYVDPKDTTKWLHVINHRKEGHFVEIFRYTDTSLIHIQTIKSNLFKSPNDIVATGPNTFYFTNDHSDEMGALRTIKDFLLIGTGSVGHYDGNTVKILANDIRYANGITIDRDSKKLFVAACTDGSIHVYNIEPFQKTGKIKCNTGVDNLEWDEEGNLWVGAHPKLLKFLSHASDANKKSPSHVIKIELNNLENPTIKNYYINDGYLFSGSSVAAVYKNKILVGSVFEDGILLLDTSQIAIE